jgi:hypothetical protein
VDHVAHSLTTAGPRTRWVVGGLPGIRFGDLSHGPDRNPATLRYHLCSMIHDQ